MARQSTPMRAPWGDIAPRLTEITDATSVRRRVAAPRASPRDRSLITVASLIALYRTNELPFHLKKALENGVTREEIIEAITHLAFYSGWPTASTALTIARQVFAEADRSNPFEGARKCRRVNSAAAASKSRPSASAAWASASLRNRACEKRRREIDPRRGRARSHLLRHRRSLWSLHQRGGRRRSVAPCPRPGRDRHQVRLPHRSRSTRGAAASTAVRSISGKPSKARSSGWASRRSTSSISTASIRTCRSKTWPEPSAT